MVGSEITALTRFSAAMTDMTVRHSTVALPMCGRMTAEAKAGRKVSVDGGVGHNHKLQVAIPTYRSWAG